MKVPDIAGYMLYEARLKLAEAGIKDYVITVITPPRMTEKKYSDNSRVIRVKSVSREQIEIIVVNEQIY